MNIEEEARLLGLLDEVAQRRLAETEGRLSLDVQGNALSRLARRAIIASTVVSLASVGVASYSFVQASQQRTVILRMVATDRTDTTNNGQAIEQLQDDIHNVIACKYRYLCMGPGGPVHPAKAAVATVAVRQTP